MDESAISALLPPEIAKVAACTYLALLFLAKLRDSSPTFLPFISNSHRQRNRLKRELEILELSRKIAEEKKALQALGVHEVPNTSLASPPEPQLARSRRRNLPRLHPERLLLIDAWPVPFRYFGLLAIAALGAYMLIVLPLGLLVSVATVFGGNKWGEEGPMIPFYLVLIYGMFRLLRWANEKNKQYNTERKAGKIVV